MSSVKIQHTKYKVLRRRLSPVELDSLGIPGESAKLILTPGGERIVTKVKDKWAFFKQRPTVRL